MNKKEFHKIRLAEIRKGNLAVLDNFLYSSVLTLSNIEQAVSHVTGVGRYKMWQKTRKREIVGAKHWFFYMSKRVFGDKYSTQYLATYAGLSTHAAVLSGCNKISGFVDTYPEYKKIATKIERCVYAG